MRRILFQLHLWIGLILGLVFVALGLSGSFVMLRPLLVPLPQVVATDAAVPALDKGLALARSAVAAPMDADINITLPDTPGEAVRIHFNRRGANAPGATPQPPIPDVFTDPASGKVLATFTPKPPAYLPVIAGFHSHLLLDGGRLIEGWFGLAMFFLGLSGLYLWWPRRGQWKNAFLVRRKAKGLRFHRELHGAVGIWMLAAFLVVTWTGAGICFPVLNRTLITWATGGGPVTPRAVLRAPLIETASTPRIGPDAAMAAARAVAGDARIAVIQIPGNPAQAISVTPNMPGDPPFYVDPYSARIVQSDLPPPNRIDAIQRMMGRLHEAIATGPVWWTLVFLSGFTPLLFFVTGLIMWWKKRQNRMAMNLPLTPEIS